MWKNEEKFHCFDEQTRLTYIGIFDIYSKLLCPNDWDDL